MTAKDTNVTPIDGAKTEAGPDASMLAAPNEMFLQKLRDTAASLEDIDQKRKDMTAQKTALLEGLAAAHAVNKTAMLAAINFIKLKEKERLNWDLTYQVTRKALGEPVQQDLFVAQLEKGVKDHVAQASAQ